MKSGSLNLLEPSGPAQACNGIALSLPRLVQRLYRVLLPTTEMRVTKYTDSGPLTTLLYCRLGPFLNLQVCSTSRVRSCIPTSKHEPVNPLKPELNPICYLLALLGVHNYLHVSRIRVKSLTFRLLMSYIYGAPVLDVSRSHTTT